jgi:hypothetical protein
MDNEGLDQVLWRRRVFGAVVLLEAFGWLGLLLFGLARISACVHRTSQQPVNTQTVKSSFVWDLLVSSDPIVSARIIMLSALWVLGFLCLRLCLRSLWQEDL